jgi:hypothetical protein
MASRMNEPTPTQMPITSFSSLQQSMGVRECIWMNQNYLDGTPCDAGGRCSAGLIAGPGVVGV